ncbi:COG1872 [Olavius algarvensis associated proteobacterium Delta 3]|nr:COG1872 [Olavius algarvensis associated proteobacterium Delta 3]
MPLSIRETPSGLVFKILVQPRSSNTAIVGIHGDALKIRLTAPPVEGKANRACIQFLAKCLGLAKSDLEIVSGHSSRAKRVRLAFRSGEDAAVAGKAGLKQALLDLAGK